jgi:hypothetical protein
LPHQHGQRHQRLKQRKLVTDALAAPATERQVGEVLRDLQGGREKKA